MQLETHQNMMHSKGNAAKAVAFVTALVNSGVKIEAIYYNDFENSPVPKVFIHKHFGKGGSRTYRRFSDHDYENALKWVKALS